MFIDVGEHDRSEPLDAIEADTFEALFNDVTGHLNAQHGRLIDLTAWLLANPRDWKGEGLWTPNQFLAWRTGVSPSTASNIVSIAQRIDELPATVEAIRRGELSLDQAMPIVRTVPSWADAAAVSLAKRLSVNQIRRLVRETDWEWKPGRKGASDQSTDDANAGSGLDDDCSAGDDPVGDDPVDDDEPTDRLGGGADDESQGDSAEPEPDLNRVAYGYGPDGRWWLHADLDADLGALIEAALDEARDAVFADRNTGSPGRSDGSAGGSGVAPFDPVSDVDGFVEIANRSLDHVTDPARRNRYRVNLHLGLDATLTNDLNVAIPESIARLLTCDGRIDPVFIDGAIPISVGRTQRTIPDRTRRTVLHRDQHCCQVPGCTATRGLDLHHIVPWADDGPTDTCNLVTLCSRHHRMHHKHRLGITGDADHPDTLLFTDARGRPIRASGANPEMPTGPPDPIRGAYEHPLGERLSRREVVFVDPTIEPLANLSRPDRRRPA